MSQANNVVKQGLVVQKLTGKHEPTEFDDAYDKYKAYCKKNGYISYGKWQAKIWLKNGKHTKPYVPEKNNQIKNPKVGDLNY